MWSILTSKVVDPWPGNNIPLMEKEEANKKNLEDLDIFMDGLPPEVLNEGLNFGKEEAKNM